MAAGAGEALLLSAVAVVATDEDWQGFAAAAEDCGQGNLADAAELCHWISEWRVCLRVPPGAYSGSSYTAVVVVVAVRVEVIQLPAAAHCQDIAVDASTSEHWFLDVVVVADTRLQTVVAGLVAEAPHNLSCAQFSVRHIGADDGSRSWFGDECSDAGALARAQKDAAAAVLKMESGAEQLRRAAVQRDGKLVAP